MIEFRAFGPTSLKGPEGNELLSVLSRPKLLSFLVVLGAWPGGGFARRDTLLGLLWEDSDPERARAALRQSIYRLRGSLGADAVESRGEDEIRLNPRVVWCDIRALEERLEQGALEEALQLHRGELMEGFFPPKAPEFERWLDQKRGEFRRRMGEAACKLAERMAAEGNLMGSGHWARRAAESCGYDEGIVRNCITLLWRLGDSGGAMGVYRSFEQKLSTEYDLSPSPATVELIQALMSQPDLEAGPGPTPLPAAGEARPEGPGPTPLPAAGEARPEGPGPTPLPAAGEARPEGPGPEEGEEPAMHPSMSWTGPSSLLPARWEWWTVVKVALPLLLLLAIPPISRNGKSALGWLKEGAGGPAAPGLRADGPLVGTVLAVVPFESLGENPESVEMAEGIEQGILSRISRMPGLTLISSRTMRRYGDTGLSVQALGRELGAGSVLMGGIEWRAGRPRVRVELYSSESGKTLWSADLEPEFGELEALQNEIAIRIAGILGAPTTGYQPAAYNRPNSRSMEAYRLYLRSQAIAGTEATPAELMVEERLLRQALACDPEFPSAWSALAMNLARSGGDFGQRPALRDSVLVAAQRALALDPTLAGAHLAMGWVYQNTGFLDQGEKSLREALRLDPNLVRAYSLLGQGMASQGRFDEAILCLRQVIQRDPGNAWIRAVIGSSYAFLGDMDRAEAWMGGGVQRLTPGTAEWGKMEALRQSWRGNFQAALQVGLRMVEDAPEAPGLRSFLASLALQTGNCSQAIEQGRRSLALDPNPREAKYMFYTSTILGVALQRCGFPAEGRAYLEESKEKLLLQVEGRSQYPLVSMEMAAVFESLGDRETAVAWVEKAYQQGFRHLGLLEVSPIFGGLRGAPSLAGTMRKVSEDLARMRSSLASSMESASDSWGRGETPFF